MEPEGNPPRYGLPPLIDKDSRLLILGTMPGERSIAMQQYYANPGNQFWKLLSAAFNEPFPTGSEARRSLLKKHRIGLWNVLASCNRNGSPDRNIRNEAPNDFEWLCRQYPGIRCVAFESKGAAAFYKKHVRQDFGWEFLTLPSASGLNSRVSFTDKLEAWRVLAK